LKVKLPFLLPLRLLLIHSLYGNGDAKHKTARGGRAMAKTSDNDKKAKDNNAKRQQKNEETLENARRGKHSYSEKTDHL
jgi:hypothetical protein